MPITHLDNQIHKKLFVLGSVGTYRSQLFLGLRIDFGDHLFLGSDSAEACLVNCRRSVSKAPQTRPQKDKSMTVPRL